MPSREIICRMRQWAGLLVFALASCRNEVVVRNVDIHPDYVCSGETIHFAWNIDNIDGIKISTNTGTTLHTESGESGSWTSGPVQASWSYLRLKGCQGDECQTEIFDVHIIDNPTWTRPYFYAGEGGLEILGAPPVVSTQTNPSYEGEVYDVTRMVTGYQYQIPAEDYSPRARVLQVKPDRMDFALSSVNVNGMFLESAAPPPAIARTFIPEGGALALPTPVPPVSRPWLLSYATPQKILVAQQFGHPEPGDKAVWSSTDLSLYPSLSFYVRCDPA